MAKTKQFLLWALTFVCGLSIGYWTERKITERSEEAIIIMLLECEASAQGALNL